jgi:hypothetical protein
MKKAFAVVALTLALVGSALAQEVKPMDDYCIKVSDIMDRADRGVLDITALVSVFSQAQQMEMGRYVSQIVMVHKQTRHDACFSANITAAKAAVGIDNAKAQQLTKAALAYATHALAEARRAQQ